ncbi:MAG: T9SS type A sorting domain-containing protein [Emticicia sp.]
MKLKSTLLVLFLCLFGQLHAQTSSSNIYSYFYSPPGLNLECGDRTINGRIYGYSNQKDNETIVFGENNKFYLEIAADSSTQYTRIQATKADIQNTGTAQFLLPDTLKYGKIYHLRMISTNPSLIPNTPYKFVFGIGKLPFDVSFKQEVAYYQSSPQTSLAYQLSQPNKQTFQGNSNTTYNIKLSNGNSYVLNAYGLPYSASIIVMPKDSVNIYKIDEIINACGIKGKVDGDATVLKKNFAEKIFIKSTNATNYICVGTKLNLDVESKSLTNKSKLKLEFSTDYNFGASMTSTIDVKLDENQKIVVDVPNKVLLENWTYYRLVSESPKITSNSVQLYLRPKPIFIIPSLSVPQSDKLVVYFNHYTTLSSSYNNTIVEATINGQKITQSDLLDGTWNVPMPKSDTVFTFSKIVSVCGEVPVNQPNIIIKPNDFVTVDFDTKSKEACQGQTVVYSYKTSNPAKNNEIRFIAYIQSYGKDLNTSTNAYIYSDVSNLKTTVDQENKTVSITIPSNLDEQLLARFRTNNPIIEDVYLTIYATNNNNNYNLRVSNTGNNRVSQVNLNPRVSLTTPSITAEKAGYINVPIKFTGGSTISYKLSNGQEGIVNHVRPDCSGCRLVSGNSNFIKVFAQKNETIRFSTAENTCAVGSVSGETKIMIDEKKPALIIDESKIAKNVCRGTAIDIPFLKVGSWPEKNTFKLHTRTYYNNNSISSNTQIVSETEKFQIKAPNNTYEYSMDVWVESNGVESNPVRISLESKANSLNFSTNQASKAAALEENTEIVSVPNTNTQTYLQVSGYGGNLTFTINGKAYKPTYKNESYSSFSDYISATKDTLLTLNAASNSCGVVEVNKKYRIVAVPTVIYSYENYSKNFLPVSPCAGSQRAIEYQYYGKVPTKDSLIIQLAKYNSENRFEPELNKLRFFDVPATRFKETLTYTLPDSLSGDYVYRIKSLTNNITSSYNYLSYTIRQKPNVKLSTQNNKAEVLGLPGASLYLNSNFEKNDYFYVTLNNGQTYSNSDFGIYYNTIRSENKESNEYKTVLRNYGKYFSPVTTTTYSVKSAYNQCGEGKAEGSATIVVQAAVHQRLSSNLLSSTFCGGDSISLDLSYFGAFPKDTLMGLYLHTNAKASYNQELATFKNNPPKISAKLPSDANSGNYFIQIRKKSRSKIYKSGQGIIGYDSLQNLQAKLNLDGELTYVSIASAPNILLSGNTEIFVGNAATLYIEPLNQKGENFATSQDTVSLIGGIAYHYQLSNGNKYSSVSQNFSLSPLKTETFSINSIKSACGEGKATGSATITVLPKSDQRIEAIGYPRNKGEYESFQNYYYYENYFEFCAGTKDSLDIKIFGKDLKTDFSKYSVLLSDNGGKNYVALKTSRSSIVQDSTAFKILRLWYQLPDNATFGKDYRIKGVSDDNTIFSTPLQNPITIREMPTASLTGNSQFATGEKVNALVKLTGEAPWLISVTDKDGNFVYNGLPTKADSTEEFKNYKPKLIYTNELKLELSPEKSNVYKVSKVFNVACEFGKVIAGELTVNLVLANENPIQNLIQIYPNPTANQINIDLTSLNAPTVVETFDSVGKLLDSKTFTQNQTQQKQSLDFSHFNSGTYLVKVNTDKFSQTYRVVKY